MCDVVVVVVAAVFVVAAITPGAGAGAVPAVAAPAVVAVVGVAVVAGAVVAVVVATRRFVWFLDMLSLKNETSHMPYKDPSCRNLKIWNGAAHQTTYFCTHKSVRTKKN